MFNQYPPLQHCETNWIASEGKGLLTIMGKVSKILVKKIFKGWILNQEGHQITVKF